MRLWPSRSRGLRLRVEWLLVAGLVGLSARADAPQSLSPAAFSSELAAWQQLSAACAGDARACDSSSLPARQKVEVSSGRSFSVSWEWLGEALSTAKTAPAADRTKAMRAAEAHLAALGVEMQSAGAAGQDIARARMAADAALRRDEFRAADGPSWLDRKLAKLQDGILRLFTGMGRLGQRAPWLAPLIEWSCFGLAAAGLLWFVRQSLARQALRISLSEGAALAGGRQRDTADWAQRAEEQAAAGDWREAVHALFWAAIALMESRRAWKPNATRTPREYPRLLRPGSDAQRAMRELTRTFERIWYGQTGADETHYRVALASFQALQAAKPERSENALASPGSPIPAGGL